uniref:Uncharacterized protein n=1 Tax=Oryzias sinensis TaxID=183150 RepID=A0A8C7WPM8_9TELE
MESNQQHFVQQHSEVMLSAGERARIPLRYSHARSAFVTFILGLGEARGRPLFTLELSAFL